MTTISFPKRRKPLATTVRGVALHAVIIAGVVVSLFPLYWLVVLATTTTSDIYSGNTLFPGSHVVENVTKVVTRVDFFGAMLHTVVVSVVVMAGVLFLDSLAAFTFAKFRFRGNRLLFGVLLVTFMLPMQLSVIPQFVTMVNLGWVGQLQAVIVPSFANAFGIFWLRQYVVSAVPDELLDAARIDGASFFRQYLTVCLPLIRPGLAFLGMFTFIGAWNDYLWPLIVLTNPEVVTLQVAIAQLNTSTYGRDYGMMMSASLMAILPLIMLFLLGSRQFIGNVLQGAIR